MKAMYGGKVEDFKMAGTKTGRTSYAGKVADMLVLDDIGDIEDRISGHMLDSIGYARHALKPTEKESLPHPWEKKNHDRGNKAPFEPKTASVYSKWKKITSRADIALITKVFKNPNPLIHSVGNRRGSPWSDDHRAVMTIMWKAGYNLGEIAWSLGRTVGAIAAQLTNLKIISRDTPNNPELTYDTTPGDKPELPWD